MDAVLLTWRWQNFLAIGVMIGVYALIVVVGCKIANTAKGALNNGSS